VTWMEFSGPDRCSSNRRACQFADITQAAGEHPRRTRLMMSFIRWHHGGSLNQSEWSPVICFALPSGNDSMPLSGGLTCRGSVRLGHVSRAESFSPHLGIPHARGSPSTSRLMAPRDPAQAGYTKRNAR